MTRGEQVSTALWNLNFWGFTNYENEVFERQITYSSTVYLQRLENKTWECFKYSHFTKSIAKTYATGDFVKCAKKAVGIIKFMESNKKEDRQ